MACRDRYGMRRLLLKEASSGVVADGSRTNTATAAPFPGRNFKVARQAWFRAPATACSNVGQGPKFLGSKAICRVAVPEGRRGTNPRAAPVEAADRGCRIGSASDALSATHQRRVRTAP